MSSQLTSGVEAWRASGEIDSFRGRAIFTRTVDGGGRDPVLVFLHGFPSSSYDFRGLLPELPGRDALLFDFLGFGLSDKPRDHTYSLFWQADLVEDLIRRRFGGRKVFLVAHDMGTSVATELLARDGRGALGLPAGGGAAVQRQHHPRPRLAHLLAEAAPLAARPARCPALERARLPPAVRLPVHRGAPAHRRGGRRPVGADLPQRRPHDGHGDDLLPRRADPLRRALARCDPRLGRPAQPRLGHARPGRDDQRSSTASASCGRRRRSTSSPTSATTPSSRIRSASPSRSAPRSTAAPARPSSYRRRDRRDARRRGPSPSSIASAARRRSRPRRGSRPPCASRRGPRASRSAPGRRAAAPRG